MSRRALVAGLACVAGTSWLPRAAGDGESWSARYPAVAERVRRDGVLTVHLLVPLCHEDQIACGGQRAGAPGDLAHNLYWGAVFGHDRFLSRKASAMRRIGGEPASGDRLARTAFGRSMPGAPFGRSAPIELVVVLDAFHGDAIGDVVDRLFTEAERGGEAAFAAASGERRAHPVDVVGFAGHNRMLDGKKAPARVPEMERRPIPSFVLACRSQQTFAKPLAERGSSLLVAARDLMAPEGYVVEAITDALARNEGAAAVRRRAVQAYARWQSITPAVAGSIFAPTA